MNNLYQNSNRYKFIEKLKERTGYYLACIDIVNFKNINEKHCFYNGDVILSQLISRIESLSSLNCPVSVCRYENDIMMIMIDTTCEHTVFSLLDKIVEHSYKYDVSFRCGYKKIDTFQKIEHFLESIIYVIKYKRYIVEKTIDETHKLNEDIEKYFAIKQDVIINNKENFQLVYQPKIANKDKSIHSCEVLSRWCHPEIGQSMPDEFLPIIKHVDKEIEFDLIIFEKACQELSSEAALTEIFSINICIKSMLYEQFAAKIIEYVEKYNMNAENITIEILEDICEYDHVELSRNIEILSEYGFRISIDDFGTGYSSYCRLAALDFTEVKIPREFLLLDNYFSIKKNRQILSGIVSMCKALNCKIVIEGVETQENVRLAEDLGIDYIQGYYYSKPLPKEAYIHFIQNYTA